MDRVFLDANVLYSAAYKLASPLRALWDLADVELSTCEEAAGEALGNLRADRPGQVAELERLIGRLRVLKGGSEETLPAESVELPPSDCAILGAAIRADATHFVTGDKTHFGPHFGRTVCDVLILPPSDHLRGQGLP